MERHDTHVVSSISSSSNNHSYDFENNINNKKTKKASAKKINLRNSQSVLNEPQLSSIQINKINSILNKYNITSEQTQKNGQLLKYKQRTEDYKEDQEIKLDNNILTTKNNTGEANAHKKKGIK